MTNTVPSARLGGLYGLYFSVVALTIGWFGPYFKSAGFSSEEIGIAIGVLTGSKIFAPYIWGAVGDRVTNRLCVMQIGMLGSTGLATLLLFELPFFNLCLVLLFFGLFWNAIIAQFDALTLGYLADQYHRYSSIRLWGSIGFILMMLFAGWLFSFKPLEFLPFLIISILFLSFVLSVLLPKLKKKRSNVSGDRPIFALLKKPVVILFFLIMAGNQFSHGPLNVFFTLYVQDYGYSAFEAGQLWALGVLAEVILFCLLPKFITQLDLRILLSVSLVLTAIRWWMIAFFADLAAILIISQLVHAFSFGAIHAVSIEFVRRWFPEQFVGRGMAIYSGFVFGLGGSLGAIASGYAWNYLGSEMTFVVAGFISLMIALAAHFGLYSAKLNAYAT